MWAQLAESVEPASEPFAAARSHAVKLEAALSSDEWLRTSRHRERRTLRAAGARMGTADVPGEHEAARGTGATRRRARRRWCRAHVGARHGAAAGDRAWRDNGAADGESGARKPGSSPRGGGAPNLPCERFSYGLRRLAAMQVARASSNEVVEIVHDDMGAIIPKRQVEGLAVRAAIDLVGFYAQREPELKRSEQALPVVGTDAKGV